MSRLAVSRIWHIHWRWPGCLERENWFLSDWTNPASCYGTVARAENPRASPKVSCVHRGSVSGAPPPLLLYRSQAPAICGPEQDLAFSRVSR